MSKGRAFFSTLPGVISALAGLVTVIAGVLAISAQIGGDGDDDKDGGSPPASESTLSGGSGGTTGAGGGSGSATTAVTGRLTASPTSLTFALLAPKEATVRVRNDATGPVTLQRPQIKGTDGGQFAAELVSCPSPVPVGVSCDVKVTFKATKAGRSTATLVVTPAPSSVRAVEVEIEGNQGVL